MIDPSAHRIAYCQMRMELVRDQGVLQKGDSEPGGLILLHKYHRY
jgi:hypothetical protein